jgi:hypothetical protein
MERDHAIKASTLVALAATRAASHAQRWAAAVLAFLLLVTFWGAWVLLIGFRPCALSYLLWR